MPSILVMVFMLQLVIHLVNTVGASTLWNLWTRLLSSTSQSAAQHRALKAQFLKLRKELNSISSQDEFAKWAKLRRQHDKVLEQLEKTKSSTESAKSTFDSVVSTLRWVSTNGLRMLFQFWFQKQPMFYIPKGWVPYYAEWLLSFPRAPIGSVSIQAWAVACAAVILLVSDAVVAIMALVSGPAPALPKEEPVVISTKADLNENKKDL